MGGRLRALIWQQVVSFFSQVVKKLLLYEYASKMDRTIDKIPSDTMRALVSWPWPGNVRELENFIVDLSRFLRQPVKTQNPLNGELSHGIVS
jgi:DNA-binding NtrC family response regulator